MMLLLLVSSISTSSDPWDKYNYSPASRTLVPLRLYTPLAPPTPAPPGTCGYIGEWHDKPGTLPAPHISLACPTSEETIKSVNFASFGNPTGSCNFVLGSCHAVTSTSIVQKLCVGKSSCIVPPTSDGTTIVPPSPLAALFGDPCPGEEKHFAVSVTCSAAASAAPLFPVTLQAGKDVVFDFGKEVGGYISVDFGAVAGGDASVQFFWSESTFYIETGDHSNGGSGDDGPLTTSGALKTGAKWTASNEHLRGGFRYLRVVLPSFVSKETAVTITNVTLAFTAAPNMGNDLRAYKSHFLSSDDTVNKVWYGCAYTVQMCSISTSHGRQWPPPVTGWHNNASCGVGDVTLVDGAKRDRTIWPGDMGVSTATAFATTGDTDAARFSLETEYLHQSADGMLPYAGPPVGFYRDRSDTYHLWALVGTFNLFEHTSNVSWMKTYYTKFKLGVHVSVAKIDATSGLMVVTDKADWQRCCQGGKNIAANSILFHVLNGAAAIATALGESADAKQYTTQATALQSAINTGLWDDNFGAFKDNPTSTLHPQDGNSLASWFGVVNATHFPTRQASISAYLKRNWGPFGSSSPEWSNHIGTFPGSMEVYQHFAAGEGPRALDLVRLQWGYMINSPTSTQSTFWEGYNADGTFNFQGIYMSNAHGWGAGPGGALTHNVLGIRADLAQTSVQIMEERHGLRMSSSTSTPMATTPTAFVIAPQPSGLEWCLGRLSFADDHAVDVRWNVTADAASMTESFTLHLDLAAARTAARGRVELPLQFGSIATAGADVEVEIEIEIDGEVAERRVRSAVEEAQSHGMMRYTRALPTPLRSSHVYVVRRRRSQRSV